MLNGILQKKCNFKGSFCQILSYEFIGIFCKICFTFWHDNSVTGGKQYQQYGGDEISANTGNDSLLTAV